MEPVTEIRHKTAVSTIRSTAEKSSRDRSRSRLEDAKKRVPQKRETSRGSRLEGCHPRLTLALFQGCRKASRRNRFLPERSPTIESLQRMYLFVDLRVEMYTLFNQTSVHVYVLDN